MRRDIICVLGSFVVDLTSCAEHLPVLGETVIGSSFSMGPGGKGSNQAIAAKRSGGNVVLLTKIGNDLFKDIALKIYEEEQLLSPFILIDEVNNTGTALILVDKKGQNSILVVPGASKNITLDEVNMLESVLEKANIFLTQLEINLDALKRGITLAYKKGVTIILNPAPVIEIDDEIFSMVDIVTPNEIEAQYLSNITISHEGDYSKVANFFFSKGVKKVIITLGEKGAYGNDGRIERIIPINKVNVLDTTGAGDAFNGGLATALSNGIEFFEAITYANTVASLSVTKFGTAPSMPSIEEIGDSLRKSF